MVFVDSLEPLLGSLATIGWPLFREPHEAWYRSGDRERGNRQFLVPDPDGVFVALR